MAGPEFDGYSIVELIRSGPIADLYRARQEPLRRPVLIKALKPTILPSSAFATILEREARLLSELIHPNILRLYDFEKRKDGMWLVLEDVDGWRLDELLEHIDTVPPTAAIAIALELARALDHAHGRGIVHRNVQPRSVLVSKQGSVRLADFAVASDERVPTAPELLEGPANFSTPSYMSPEQILGEPADPRSDLFSLGVVLFEMLSGRRPFDSPDDRSATLRIRHDPPPPLAPVGSGVPGALERTVHRCLEKLPGDRFHSAAELILALERSLGDAGGGSPQSLIARALYDAGLALTEPRDDQPGVPAIDSTPERPSIAPTVRALFACLLLIAGGGATIQWVASREGEAAVRRGGAHLELVPPHPGYLRVVATPWAHVVVDGQRVDTTPFARAIPLRAGKHYVRLEHPNAPVERREVEIGLGETVLLDITMKVQAPTARDGSIESGAFSADSGIARGDASAPSP